jgi:pimeloyl-ACP methyl ester carboxylesterase
MYQFEALGLALARRGYRVLLYDAFGRGESDLPFVPGGHSVEFYVGLLARVVNFVLGPDARFALLGFSMGGAVAVEFAARHAARVSHLVLAGPAGYIQRSDLACAQCCPLVPRWMAMRQGIKLLADNPRQDVSRPDLHRELTELACERHNDSLDRNPGRLAAFVYSLSQFPFGGVEPSARRAGELLDRVLLLWGDLDGQDGKGVDFSGLKQYRQAMPRAEVRVFPGVAHAIYIEDPAGLEDAVATFLAK